MRSGRILQFAQTHRISQRISESAPIIARPPNSPDKVFLEIASILAAAVGTALGINLLLLAFHIG